MNAHRVFFVALCLGSVSTIVALTSATEILTMTYELDSGCTETPTGSNCSFVDIVHFSAGKSINTKGTKRTADAIFCRWASTCSSACDQDWEMTPLGNGTSWASGGEKTGRFEGNTPSYFSAGDTKLCCRADGESDCVEQTTTNVEATVVAGTDASFITAMKDVSGNDLTEVNSLVDVVIVITKQAGAAFCELSRDECHERTNCHIEKTVAIGANTTETVTWPAAKIPGIRDSPKTLIVCCRMNPGNDCVQQTTTDVGLTAEYVIITPTTFVTAIRDSNSHAHVTALASYVSYNFTKMNAVGDCFVLTNCTNGCTNNGVNIAQGTSQSASWMISNLVGGANKLCCRQDGADDCVEQTSSDLNFTALDTCSEKFSGCSGGVLSDTVVGGVLSNTQCLLGGCDPATCCVPKCSSFACSGGTEHKSDDDDCEESNGVYTCTQSKCCEAACLKRYRMSCSGNTVVQKMFSDAACSTEIESYSGEYYPANTTTKVAQGVCASQPVWGVFGKIDCPTAGGSPISSHIETSCGDALTKNYTFPSNNCQCHTDASTPAADATPTGNSSSSNGTQGSGSGGNSTELSSAAPGSGSGSGGSDLKVEIVSSIGFAAPLNETMQGTVTEAFCADVKSTLVGLGVTTVEPTCTIAVTPARRRLLTATSYDLKAEATVPAASGLTTAVNAGLAGAIVNLDKKLLANPKMLAANGNVALTVTTSNDLSAAPSSGSGSGGNSTELSSAAPGSGSGSKQSTDAPAANVFNGAGRACMVPSAIVFVLASSLFN